MTFLPRGSVILTDMVTNFLQTKYQHWKKLSLVI
jgi:hypothetical protein